MKKDVSGKPERRVISNAEKGLQVCGAKNKFLQPCQRVGVCPFHAPKNPKDGQADPSKPASPVVSRKRKATIAWIQELEHKENSVSPHRDFNDFRSATPQTHPSHFPEEFPPPQYSKTECISRFPPQINSRSYEYESYYKKESTSSSSSTQLLSPSFPLFPPYNPSSQGSSRSSPSSPKEYYPRPYFPGSQYKRAYSSEEEEGSSPRHEDGSHIPSIHRREEETEHEFEKERKRDLLSLPHFPHSMDRPGLAPLNKIVNIDDQKNSLPPLWTYLRGGITSTEHPKA